MALIGHIINGNGINLVRVKNVLIEENGSMPSYLSNSFFRKDSFNKDSFNKETGFLAKPYGLHLLAIFTALSTFYLE